MRGSCQQSALAAGASITAGSWLLTGPVVAPPLEQTTIFPPFTTPGQRYRSCAPAQISQICIVADDMIRSERAAQIGGYSPY